MSAFVPSPAQEQAMEDLRNVPVFEISKRADVGTPDSHSSAGGELINTIIVNYLEAIEYSTHGDVGEDRRMEIANSSPSVISAQSLAEFRDLEGIHEPIPEGDFENMESLISAVVESMAERIVEAVHFYYCEVLEDAELDLDDDEDELCEDCGDPVDECCCDEEI